MSAAELPKSLHWTNWIPPLALIALVAVWGRALPGIGVAVIAVLLCAAVLAAVHHAEVVAHRVGEPFGSIVLAVAVTIIEVGLIVSVMLGGGEGSETLARDTVFAAVMITVNGIMGLSLLVSALRYRFSHFNAEGSGGALATVLVLAVTCLVLPTFTSTALGPVYSTSQLAFAGVSALTLWVMFISTQTYRHREFFLPVDANGELIDDEDDHADPPSDRAAWFSLGLLMVSLVAVVGLAKVESPAIEAGVHAAGLPTSFVGVIIAALVLAPETLAAVNNARRGRVQTSLNLGLGSAIASIGLTVPTLAVVTVVLDLPLHLGLGDTHIVLLALSAVVAVLTIVPGRATRLQGGVHLIILGAYIFLSAIP